MARLYINTRKLYSNYIEASKLCHNQDIKLYFVTKALSNSVIEALDFCKATADVDIAKLRFPEKMFIKLPTFNDLIKLRTIKCENMDLFVSGMVTLDYISNLIEYPIDITIVVEAGDLLEGVPHDLLENIISYARSIPIIKKINVGANFGCHSGIIPSVDTMNFLLYLKQTYGLDGISGGASSVLPLVINNTIPSAISNLRIGEAILLGTNPADGGHFEKFHTDCFVLEAEVVECYFKMGKDLEHLPRGNTTFELPPENWRDNEYRLVVALGLLDVDLKLTPYDMDLSLTIKGGSSEYIVCGSDKPIAPYKRLRFIPNYTSLARAMLSPRIKKIFI